MGGNFAEDPRNVISATGETEKQQRPKRKEAKNRSCPSKLEK